MPAPISTAFMVPISTGRPTAAVVTAPRQPKMMTVIRTAASLPRLVAVMAGTPPLALLFAQDLIGKPLHTFPDRTLHRPLALHRDAGAGSRVRPVIPHRAMLGAAVVPEGDRILGPAEATLKQRVFRVLVEIG